MAYVKYMLNKWTNVWRLSLWTPTAHVMRTDVTDEPDNSCPLREDTSQQRQRWHRLTFWIIYQMLHKYS